MPKHRVKRELVKIAEVLHLRSEDEANLRFDRTWQPFADYTELTGPFTGARTGELIGFYLGHLMLSDPHVKSIFGALILCSLDFSVERGSLSADMRALLDGFLRSTAPEWELGVMRIECVLGAGVDYLPAYESDEKSARARFSKQLGLRFPAVDWAPTNADAMRLPEFLTFSDDRCQGLSRVDRQILFELVLFSISDALHKGTLECDQRAEQFIHQGTASEVWPTWRRSCLHPDLCDVLEGSSAGFNPRELISGEFELRWPALNWVKTNANAGKLDRFLQAYLDGLAETKPLKWYLWLGKLIPGSLTVSATDGELPTTTLSLLFRFIQEQTGEQAVNIATWLRTADKRQAAVVVRAIIGTRAEEKALGR